MLNQTGEIVQLRKHKEFIKPTFWIVLLLGFIGWFLFSFWPLFILLLIYLLDYLIRKDLIMTLSIDEFGKLQVKDINSKIPQQLFNLDEDN